MPEHYDFSIHDPLEAERIGGMLRGICTAHTLRFPGGDGQRQWAFACAEMLGELMAVSDLADERFGVAYKQALLERMAEAEKRTRMDFAADGIGSVSRG